CRADSSSRRRNSQNKTNRPNVTARTKGLSPFNDRDNCAQEPFSFQHAPRCLHASCENCIRNNYPVVYFARCPSDVFSLLATAAFGGDDSISRNASGLVVRWSTGLC